MKNNKVVFAVVLAMVGSVAMAQWGGVQYSNPDGDMVRQFGANLRTLSANNDRIVAQIMAQQRQQEEEQRRREEERRRQTWASSSSGSSDYVQTSGGGSVDELLALINQAAEGRNAGDCRKVIAAESRLVNCDPAAANVAGYYVDMFFQHWNLDERDEAKACLRKGIRLMRGHDLLGGGCEARAVALLAKAEADDIGSRFSVNDLTSKLGIERYVVQPVYDRYNERTNASISRSQAEASYFSSRAQGYRLEGEADACMAKLMAGDAYRKATGYRFDPNDRPAYSGDLSDKWLACKRIYDIFGE